MGSLAGQMTYTVFWLPVPEKGQKGGGGDRNHFFKIAMPFNLERRQGPRFGKGSTDLVWCVLAQRVLSGLGVGWG